MTSAELTSAELTSGELTDEILIRYLYLLSIFYTDKSSKNIHI